MANNVQQYQQPPTQQHQQQTPGNSSPHHCKECGLYLNSAESLEVHLQYHKENLLNKWATQATASSGHNNSEETNNNQPPAQTTQTPNANGNNNNTSKVIKREFSNTIAAADSSDAMMKKSPEYGSRATPEINVSFGHPPTPQSYHSASSPYQTPDNSAFSPGYNNQPQGGPQQQQQQHQSYQSFQDAQFYGMEAYNAQQQQQQQNAQEYVGKMTHQSYRYHPYQQHNTHQVTSSSPAYPPQPTPSPSPKQCDKCGYVCESATQLIEHLNVAHPQTPASNYGQNHFIFGSNPADVVIKQEEPDVQSEILDLDSHKVVHQVYPEGEEVSKSGMNGHNPHSVSAMLSPWPQGHQGAPPAQAPPTPQQQQQNLQSPKMFGEVNAFPKFHQQQQSSHEFNPGMMSEHAYRPFEHMPPQPTPPIISSTQVPNNPVQPTPPTNQKSTNWKSNEARRPKTYNCTACNKWFTSSGHLKRHYNTTLHKNAVKSSGQPDPASLPISAHHHPARESASNREDHSNSPGDDSRSEDSMNNSYERPGGIPGLLQQPPAGPYDRQPAPNIPNIPHPHPHPLHSPMAPNTHPASPPNGEAGLSASTTNIDSRGLLSISNSASNHGFTHIPPPGGHHHHHHHMMSSPAATMDNQFQMYPNECAPHATQATAAITSSRSTTGEQQQQPQHHHQQQQQPAMTIQPVFAEFAGGQLSSQPLPSFAQFNNRYGLLLGYNGASVGGPGPATVPYATTTTTYFATASLPSTMIEEGGNYQLTVLTPVTAAATAASTDGQIDIERRIDTVDDIDIKLEAQPASPEKARTKRDYEDTATGSPRISSTSGNAAISQISKNGVHKCFDCDKVFNKSCYLTQHNKTFHSGDKPFKCMRCGKRFSVDEQYQEHLAKHAGDKPHKCDLCPKQFNHKTDLRRHMCLHTGQKPYTCEFCQKGFIRKDHMLKHTETHSKKLHSRGQNAAHLIQTRG